MRLDHHHSTFTVQTIKQFCSAAKTSKINAILVLTSFSHFFRVFPSCSLIGWCPKQIFSFCWIHILYLVEHLRAPLNIIWHKIIQIQFIHLSLLFRYKYFENKNRNSHSLCHFISATNFLGLPNFEHFHSKILNISRVFPFN